MWIAKTLAARFGEGQGCGPKARTIGNLMYDVCLQICALLSYRLCFTVISMRSRISSKGQITIPAELREALGLRAGTLVVFERRPEGALLRKGTTGEHPVDKLYGLLKLPTSVDALLDRMRGPRPTAGRKRARRQT
jgi:AbrB family looped-hinge helix DNA binding protein